jgi:hypothetical protein
MKAGTEQAEAQVVVHRDEAAHQEKPGGEQTQQAGVGQCAADRSGQFPDARPARVKTGGRDDGPAKRDGAGQANYAGHGQCPPPPG